MIDEIKIYDIREIVIKTAIQKIGFEKLFKMDLKKGYEVYQEIDTRLNIWRRYNYYTFNLIKRESFEIGFTVHISEII